MNEKYFRRKIDTDISVMRIRSHFTGSADPVMENSDPDPGDPKTPDPDPT